MPMNRIQFQQGLSLPEFFSLYGSEEQCEAALEQARWPEGFRCPLCGAADHYVLHKTSRKTCQCKVCRHQTSLIAGTLFQGTKLSLRRWFLAIYLVTQAKTGLSALALKRQLRVSYPTAWLVHHKLMRAMNARDAQYALSGEIQIDDAYLGGELRGGKAGRGSENKVPFIAAVSVSEEGHPLFAKLTPVKAFSGECVAEWASSHLDVASRVLSDGLACFRGVTDVGCEHFPSIVGGRKPDELPQFFWVNTVLGNLKTSFNGAYHAFDFRKYAARYLGAFAYRFNRRFDLRALPGRLLNAAVSTAPLSARNMRLAGDCC